MINESFYSNTNKYFHYKLKLDLSLNLDLNFLHIFIYNNFIQKQVLIFYTKENYILE